LSSADIRRYLANWQAEVDSTLQYLAMAAHEPDKATARVYQSLADIESKHVDFWEKRLRTAGHKPGPRKPSWRARLLIFSARRWGAKAVLETVASNEYEARDDYLPQKETASTSMTSEEHAHARVLRTLLAKTGMGAASFSRTEKGHRRLGGNALRAAVLGSNDGLSSNLSLVMGVAGATVDTHTLLLTGIAGLLAGACSMAMGEWISVTSSRELAEREIQTEKDELEANPEEERQELQLIYEAKGLSASEAAELSTKLLSDPKAAIDVLSREELGIDPSDQRRFALGSSWHVHAAVRVGRIDPGPAADLPDRHNGHRRQPGSGRGRPLSHRHRHRGFHRPIGDPLRRAAVVARLACSGCDVRHRPTDWSGDWRLRQNRSAEEATRDQTEAHAALPAGGPRHRFAARSGEACPGSDGRCRHPLRFVQGEVPSVPSLLAGMTKRAQGMKLDKIRPEDVARSGGSAVNDGDWSAAFSKRPCC
jgi:vacuolar iron transporter family protein